MDSLVVGSQIVLGDSVALVLEGELEPIEQVDEADVLGGVQDCVVHADLFLHIVYHFVLVIYVLDFVGEHFCQFLLRLLEVCEGGWGDCDAHGLAECVVLLDSLKGESVLVHL